MAKKPEIAPATPPIPSQGGSYEWTGSELLVVEPPTADAETVVTAEAEDAAAEAPLPPIEAGEPTAESPL